MISITRGFGQNVRIFRDEEYLGSMSYAEAQQMADSILTLIPKAKLPAMIPAEDAFAMMTHWLNQTEPPFCGPHLSSGFPEVSDWLVWRSDAFVFDLRYFTSKESLRDAFRCAVFNVRLHLGHHAAKAGIGDTHSIAGTQMKVNRDIDVTDNTFSPHYISLVARAFLKPNPPAP